MSFYKKIEGYKTTLESDLVLDKTPKEGSFNVVTSDGVAKAIGDASEPLDTRLTAVEGCIPDTAGADNKLVTQSALDAAEAGWQAGYTPKGDASVSTLNGLTGQSNGDTYILTDSGTLTDGSVVVAAGDSVAWDDANSKWYKVSQYALEQFGTNEIHNLTTNATEDDLVSGNYLALDGSTGTKKLPAQHIAPRSVQDNIVSGLAPQFFPTEPYSINEIVQNNGKLYRFQKDHAAGAWASGDVFEIKSSASYDNKYVSSALLKRENLASTTLTFESSGGQVVSFAIKAGGVYRIQSTTSIGKIYLKSANTSGTPDRIGLLFNGSSLYSHLVIADTNAPYIQVYLNHAGTITISESSLYDLYRLDSFEGKVSVPASIMSAHYFPITNIPLYKGRVYEVAFTFSNAGVNYGTGSVKIVDESNNTIKTVAEYDTHILEDITAYTLYKCCFSVDSDIANAKVRIGFISVTLEDDAVLFAYCRDVTEDVGACGFDSSPYYLNKKFKEIENSRRDSVLSLAFFSDVHGESRSVDKILQTAYGLGCSCVVNGGDSVAANNTSGLTWLNNLASASPIPLLSILGNHDSWEDSFVWSDAQTDYNLIMPYLINTAGVIVPDDASTAYKCYWYKDFGDIRIIGLDTTSTTAGTGYNDHWDNAQQTWFASVLADARTNGKHVICVTHYPFDKAKSSFVAGCWTSWNNYKNGYRSFDSLYTPNSAVAIVKDFIDAGGIFVCWMSGHMHCDYTMTNEDDPRQMMFGIQTASYRRYPDSYRPTDFGMQQYDCFNLVNIDTSHKFVKFVRLGSDFDSAMQERKPLSLDYDHGIVY